MTAGRSSRSQHAFLKHPVINVLELSFSFLWFPHQPHLPTLLDLPVKRVKPSRQPLVWYDSLLSGYTIGTGILKSVASILILLLSDFIPSFHYFPYFTSLPFKWSLHFYSQGGWPTAHMHRTFSTLRMAILSSRCVKRHLFLLVCSTKIPQGWYDTIRRSSMDFRELLCVSRWVEVSWELQLWNNFQDSFGGSVSNTQMKPHAKLKSTAVFNMFCCPRWYHLYSHSPNTDRVLI